MAKRIGLVFVIALIALTAFTMYRNVLTDDSTVRAMAETLAHDTCHDYKTTRIEDKRDVLSESFEFTMQNSASIAISCRRPYIAFGDYACTATKR